MGWGAGGWGVGGWGAGAGCHGFGPAAGGVGGCQPCGWDAPQAWGCAGGGAGGCHAGGAGGAAWGWSAQYGHSVFEGGTSFPQRGQTQLNMFSLSTEIAPVQPRRSDFWILRAACAPLGGYFTRPAARMCSERSVPLVLQRFQWHLRFTTGAWALPGRPRLHCFPALGIHPRRHIWRWRGLALNGRTKWFG